MKKILVALFLASVALAERSYAQIAIPTRPSVKTYEEIKCHLRDPIQEDEVRVYHLGARDQHDGFKSIAIFLLKQGSAIVPAHVYEHAGEFPATLSIQAVDCDNDGLSEFYIQTWHSGASHYDEVVQIIKLVTDDDGAVVRRTLYENSFRDLVKPTKIEKAEQPGSYRIIADGNTITLVNGSEYKPK